MRTSKFHNSDVTDEVINGPRPSTLRINKDSHRIHKSSSSPSHHHQPVPGGGKRRPVIIYTQSPRIIHTQAHDFMTLVQKLTGLDRAEEQKEDNRAKSDLSELSTTDECSISNDDTKNNVVTIKNNDDHRINNNYYYLDNDENELSSVLPTDEKFVAHDSTPVSSSMHNMSTYMNNNPYLIDQRTMANSLFDRHPISLMKGYPDY